MTFNMTFINYRYKSYVSKNLNKYSNKKRPFIEVFLLNSLLLI